MRTQLHYIGRLGAIFAVLGFVAGAAVLTACDETSSSKRTTTTTTETPTSKTTETHTDQTKTTEKKPDNPWATRSGR
jgi:hypothetical protein